MRRYIKIFKDDIKLHEMIEMREHGWTLESLALIFGVDHSSIYKWCRIKGIKRNPNTISIDIPFIIGALELKPDKEKNYADYLHEENKRHSILARLTKI